MDTTNEDFKKLQKGSIDNYLFELKVNRRIAKEFEKLVGAKNNDIKAGVAGVGLVVRKVFSEIPITGGDLEKFLLSKLPVPHEKHENCLHVVVEIITKLLTDSLQYGKTNRAGVDQIGFIGPNEGARIWHAIEPEFVKICNDYFNVTPFLDIEKENFPDIGFYINSIWKNPKERIAN